jgi:glutaconate CoA-transferase subunit A
VVETPNGAHFCECPPDYGRDEAFQREYADAARDAASWEAFAKRYLALESEEAYQRAVRSR